MTTKQIPIDRLRACRVLVTHENCSDGIASAIVVRDVLPNIAVRFVQYGAPSREQLEPERGMLFVDMTPPRERAIEFAQRGAIVLDHHKAQRDVVGLFGPLGVYADNEENPDERSISGAALAYLHVWGPLMLQGMLHSPSVKQRGDRIAELTRLVGIRDTWTKGEDWFEAEHLDAALKFYPIEHWLGNGSNVSPRLPADNDVDVGRYLHDKRIRDAITLAERAASYTIRGKRVAICNDTAYLISNAADALAEAGHELAIAFSFQCHGDTLSLNVQLRSRGNSDIDVGAFGREHGGGGHMHAAGFTVPAPRDENPFDWLALATARYLDRDRDPEYATVEPEFVVIEPDVPRGRARMFWSRELNDWVDHDHATVYRRDDLTRLMLPKGGVVRPLFAVSEVD